MFGGIKQRIGNHVLKKQRKLLTCKRHFHNFETAKSIGLLYPYSPALDGEINKLIKFFTEKHIKVQALTFSPAPTIPQAFVSTINKAIFCKEQLNWYKKPVAPEVDKFIKDPFDILIDFSHELLYPLQYIITLSHAAMRVGKLSYSNNPYEFILSVPEISDNKFFIEQLKHYLSSIQIK